MGECAACSSAGAQCGDWSARFPLSGKGKFYLTALGEYGKEARKFSHILIGDDLWGGALRASYDFVLGPVSIQANYSSLGKNVGFYINAGFVF